jgi:hypothetical protein
VEREDRPSLSEWEKNVCPTPYQAQKEKLMDIELDAYGKRPES